MKRQKGTNGRPKHAKRLVRAKAGLPKRGDPYGNGVPIVAKYSGQCLRQDEGEQELSSYEG